MPFRYIGILSLLLSFLMIGCQSTQESVVETAVRSEFSIDQDSLAQIDTDTATLAPVVVSTDTPGPPPSFTSVPTAISTDTPVPTVTPTPKPTETPSLAPTWTIVPPILETSITPSPTSLATEAACSDRIPEQNDLFTVVTKRYGLSREYAPKDLVPLSDYFDNRITIGYPTSVRIILIPPLIALIDEMKAAGLDPKIISGYRDYSTQALAYDKWQTRFPDRADQLSARPGHSEHQLGTTVDFGSYVLANYLTEEEQDLEFHTFFYKTPEGEWLLNNAHRYGFTLSYPREAIDITGFYYEPWHYRYVGIEMATFLKETGISLTEHQLIVNPNPCG
ncbi:MAG: M15 family metallopeptidase [Chloroflexota bacterium]